ncbi:MAG TPA: zinc ribbon domain-containing protein [Gaiellaceae bacterium]|nr:zinc ribbon domain-containing protein [Gaiellaceae bacterium]
MSLRVFVCGSCGRAAFPQRLLCPDCGARDWREERVESGVLEAVADRGEVRVGAVRTPLGPLAIVRVEGDAQAGAEVALDEDGEVPVARA